MASKKQFNCSKIQKRVAKKFNCSTNKRREDVLKKTWKAAIFKSVLPKTKTATKANQRNTQGYQWYQSKSIVNLRTGHKKLAIAGHKKLAIAGFPTYKYFLRLL